MVVRFLSRARVNRIVAKEKFYNGIDYKTKMLFQNEIARIIWEYKLAPETVNLPAKKWPEVEVFRIELKNYEIPMKVLQVIDAAIPYPILFVVVKGTATKVVMSYKEQSRKNENVTKVDTYFETDWNDARLGGIKIDGLDIDTVYENLLRQVAGERLSGARVNDGCCEKFRAGSSSDKECSISGEAGSSSEIEASDWSRAGFSGGIGDSSDVGVDLSVKAEVERMKEREKIQRQIDALDRKIKAEPSLGKKQKLAEGRWRLISRIKEM